MLSDMAGNPMTTDEKLYAEILDALRRYRGLTISELARRLDMTRQTVSQKVLGDARITLHEVKTFAAALEVDPAVFLLDSADDAVRWVLDHPQEVTRRSSWIGAARLFLADAA